MSCGTASDDVRLRKSFTYLVYVTPLHMLSFERSFPFIVTSPLLWLSLRRSKRPNVAFNVSSGVSHMLNGGHLARSMSLPDLAVVDNNVEQPSKFCKRSLDLIKHIVCFLASPGS